MLTPQSWQNIPFCQHHSPRNHHAVHLTLCAHQSPTLLRSNSIIALAALCTLSRLTARSALHSRTPSPLRRDE